MPFIPFIPLDENFPLLNWDNAMMGLLACTPDLTPKHILSAYQQGIFPWHEENDTIYWFTQVPRAVLLPEHLHISRSLNKSIQKQKYTIKINHDFAGVIQNCAQIPRDGASGSWISPRFQNAYCQLHQMGYAHSFEFYDELGHLMGGFYGVQIGSVFYGESMFSRQSQASKITFALAVPFLQNCGIQLIDCQQDTEYLRGFGSQLMSQSQFQAALNTLNPKPLISPITPQILHQNI